MLEKSRLLPFNFLLKLNDQIFPKVQDPISIKIIWVDISFGQLISSRNFFLALKQKYPNGRIDLIVNKKVYSTIINSKLTFKIFFDTVHPYTSVIKIYKQLKKKSDMIIIPSTNKFYFENYFLMLISNSVKKFGVIKFNGRLNPYKFLIKNKLSIDFIHTPDIHISQMLLILLNEISNFDEPKNFMLNFNLLEEKYENEMKKTFGFSPQKKIIVINLFTEEKQNKLSNGKFLELLNLLSNNSNLQLCIIDNEKKTNLKRIENNINYEYLYFPNNNLKELINLLNFVDLVITCDSELMHIAGAIDVSQISLFGLSNPFIYAPIGNKKRFLKKSDFIEDITAEDIFNECLKIIDTW